MEPAETTITPTPAPVRGRLSPVFYLLGVLFFFLPFVDIRCNNLSLLQVTGINLATGYKIKSPTTGSILGNLDQLNDEELTFSKKGDSSFNIYALLALVLGTAGLIISFLRLKNRELLGILTGVGAAAALIGLMVDIRSQVKVYVSQKTDSSTIRVAVDFTPWFYITILLFLAGAVLSYLAIKGRTTIRI